MYNRLINSLEAFDRGRSFNQVILMQVVNNVFQIPGTNCLTAAAKFFDKIRPLIYTIYSGDLL